MITPFIHSANQNFRSFLYLKHVVTDRSWFSVAMKAWESHLTFSKRQVSLLWDGSDSSYLTEWLWGLNGAMCTDAQYTDGWTLPCWPFPELAHRMLRAQMWAGFLFASGLPVLFLFPKCVLSLTSDFLRKWFSQSTYACNKEKVMPFSSWWGLQIRPWNFTGVPACACGLEVAHPIFGQLLFSPPWWLPIASGICSQFFLLEATENGSNVSSTWQLFKILF